MKVIELMAFTELLHVALDRLQHVNLKNLLVFHPPETPGSFIYLSLN